MTVHGGGEAAGRRAASQLRQHVYRPSDRFPSSLGWLRLRVSPLGEPAALASPDGPAEVALVLVEVGSFRNGVAG